jgi:hypothetical protein
MLDLLQISDKHRVVLVRAAPATGKTSLMQQLARKLHDEGCAFGSLPITNVRLDEERSEGRCKNVR